MLDEGIGDYQKQRLETVEGIPDPVEVIGVGNFKTFDDIKSASDIEFMALQIKIRCFDQFLLFFICHRLCGSTETIVLSMPDFYKDKGILVCCYNINFANFAVIIGRLDFQAFFLQKFDCHTFRSKTCLLCRAFFEEHKISADPKLRGSNALLLVKTIAG
jgi:hypothetical protein